MVSLKDMSEEQKKLAGYAAVEYLKEGMQIGLGSGSTVRYFIEKLGEMCSEGFDIRVCPTSNESMKLAFSAKIPIVAINRVDSLDLDVDGADQCDSRMRLIKGLGGALLREKIIASLSKEMIVIVEERKLSEKLGNGPLPVEVVPVADQMLARKFKALGFDSTPRLKKNGSHYVTDNQNHIIDIHLPIGLDHPEELDAELKAIPGVVETGFFFNLASKVLVARNSGKVEVLAGSVV